MHIPCAQKDFPGGQTSSACNRVTGGTQVPTPAATSQHHDGTVRGQVLSKTMDSTTLTTDKVELATITRDEADGGRVPHPSLLPPVRQSLGEVRVMRSACVGPLCMHLWSSIFKPAGLLLGKLGYPGMHCTPRKCVLSRLLLGVCAKLSVVIAPTQQCRIMRMRTKINHILPQLGSKLAHQN